MGVTRARIMDSWAAACPRNRPSSALTTDCFDDGDDDDDVGLHQGAQKNTGEISSAIEHDLR